MLGGERLRLPVHFLDFWQRARLENSPYRRRQRRVDGTDIDDVIVMNDTWFFLSPRTKAYDFHDLSSIKPVAGSCHPGK
jgi:hypothetical protein